MTQAAPRQRTLGDKLFFLGQLSREDLIKIEELVDYRTKILVQEEYDRMKAASKGLKLVRSGRKRRRSHGCTVA